VHGIYGRKRVSCPSVDELVAYGAGRLTADARASIQRHAADCAACRLALAELVRAQAPAHAASVSAETDSASEVVVERYEIRRRLGGGAMGVVYLAHDTQLDRPVALKLLHRRSIEGDGPALEEARSLAQVRHPNVVTVFDAALHRGRLCIVMEYVDGETLRAWVASRPRSWKQILGAMLDAARGVAAANAAGLTHGDLKPDNVLIGRDGRVQVTDFGLARPARAGGNGNAALAGTPAYMAPEQLDGRAADARSDQFSFCVSLYEMLLGRRPFAANDLAALRQEVRRPPSFTSDIRLPRAVVRAIARGLAVAPEARYPSVEALLADLQSWPRRRRGWALSVGTLALAALVARAVHYEKTPLNRICRVDSRQAGLVLKERRRAAGAAGELEGYIRRWVTARVGACEDADATDATDPIAHARYLGRLRCFEDLRQRTEAAMATRSDAPGDLPAPESCLAR
jgi:predicted Ser/Thr protein kinase